jgi:hypothetical protein
MLHTTEIAAARAALGADGGWLLDLGDGHYLVTGDPGTVAELRDKSFIDLCEAAGCWDESDDNFPAWEAQ